MLLSNNIASAFSAFEQNTSARIGSSTHGTTVTPSTGSKGSWVELIAATARDSFAIVVMPNANNTGATSRNTVLDIGIGAGSSEIVLIPDLLCGSSPIFGGSNQVFEFPIFIPAGSRISARAQSSVATDFTLFIQVGQQPSSPESRVAVLVEALGLGTLPAGTAITAGTTAEGAWTSLGTTVSNLWHWQIGMQVDTADTSWLNGVYGIELAFGDATNKEIIIQEKVSSITASEAMSGGPPTINVRRFVPAGSEIFIRAQVNAAGLDPIQLTAYGAGG